ncbi:exosome non-catalytic core subunit [Martiniozyma asiatica (nom. inval.)]|nr:exosome non-catalytic core subunit [Martiniozyma asiatica]
MTEIEEQITIQTHQFVPSELALIAPDVALQKYLQTGYRPSLRKFFEFKPIVMSTAGVSRYDTLKGQGKANDSTAVIGSSIVKSHGTSVITFISASLIEDSFEAVNDYRTRLESDLIITDDDLKAGSQKLEYMNGTVYPVVEIAKGMSGPPTPEEIELGERLYQNILNSGVIPRSSLNVNIGLKCTDEKGNVTVLHKGEDQLTDDLLNGLTGKSFSFVLQARLQVFGANGPVYDLCHAGLLKALKDVKLPEVYLTEKEATLRTRGGKSVAVDQAVEGYDLLCDPIKYKVLQLNESKLSWSSTFGVVDLISVDEDGDGDVEMNKRENTFKQSVLLADLEGDIENFITKRISAVVNKDGHFVNFTLCKSGGSSSNKISREAIQQALDLSNSRSHDMISQI